MDEFEEIFEHAPCGNVALGPDGRVERVNSTLLNWLGLSAPEMLGKRLTDFLNMAGRIYYETHISPLLRIQGFFNGFALDLVSGTGKTLNFIASASETRHASGKAASTLFALILAGDRRLYERQLLEARDAATSDLARELETSQLREQFIAVLGHDLKNPLASISGGARLLSRGERTEREHQILAMLTNSSDRMADLIDNVLDFARGRLGGGITLDRNTDEPLEPVLQLVIDELRMSSPDRTINTTFDMTCPVDCDRGRIGQLVSNLVGNALTHGAANAPVDVRAATANGKFEFSVANSGTPIPGSAMSKLFEPFFRNQGRDSRQGLGLGLYIASQIAAAHDGAISVSSTDDETRFTLLMPLRQPADASRA